MNEHSSVSIADAASDMKVHLLDVGTQEYGDAAMCQLGNVSVLIDGAHEGDRLPKGDHPGIPAQLSQLLDVPQPPFRVDLLVVTHGHKDHIGCLPHLVQHDLLRAEWALVADPRLGWGRAAQDSIPPVPVDSRAHMLAAGLREEPITRATPDQDLDQFLMDAVSLEQRYNKMLDTLQTRGTKVVRYGKQSHADLVEAFSQVGLSILGPSRDQLVMCADFIAARSQDALRQAADLLSQDVGLSTASAYRQLLGVLDTLDASQRPGPFVNLQSLVLTFEMNGRKLLFAGDMQFADPDTQNPVIVEGVRSLRDKIRSLSPYSFVKLSHHGSHNAFSSDILDELGATKVLGICAGADSTHHPHPSVLRLLQERRAQLQWGRTDKNGLTTFQIGQTGVVVTPAKGQLNDPQPNKLDVPVPVPAPTPAPIPAREEPVSIAPRHGEIVEVITKVPHRTTRVQVTIEVAPGDESQSLPPKPRLDTGTFTLAGGRPIPQLLFVTHPPSLSRNIGELESQRLLADLRDQGQRIHEIPSPDAGSDTAVAEIRRTLAEARDIEGLVILGGYDVVPAVRMECLPSSLQVKVPDNEDPDDFIVWSDDPYADKDGDKIPEVPVSRIPDGKYAGLMIAALGASPGAGRPPRTGVRNVARPFADGVYARLPGVDPISVSQPATFDQQPVVRLDGERIYLMLHGDWVDGSRFWGEDTPNNVEAVNTSNIPPTYEGVVFTGCCWGALTADTPANRVVPGRSYGQKTAESSIALTFLLRGATGFVGCTGAHYSPTEPPFQYFGGPMHEAFWSFYDQVKSPARALFEAKRQFASDMPHGQSRPLLQAIEYKIWRQYTCLGLGW